MSEILKETIKESLLVRGFNTHAEKLAHSYTFQIGDNNLASFEVWPYPKNRTSVLWNFDVYEGYKGKGIAKIMLQEIAKFLLKNNITEMDIMFIRHDGVTFWPWVGALPITYPTQRDLNFYINQYAETEKDRQVILALIEEGKQNEDLWFALTDKDIGVSKPLLEKINSRNVDAQMYLDFERAEVQQRLGL